MASTLSDSQIEYILEEAQKALDSEGQEDSEPKMDRALEMIAFTKEVLEAEMTRIHEDIETKLAYLMKNSAIKVEATRRMRAMKVAIASLAISVSSLTFGIRCSANAAMRDALPWAFGLGATSLLFSFIYCKRIWRNFKRGPESETVENSAQEIQATPDIPARILARRIISRNEDETNEPVPVVETNNKPKERGQRRIVSA